MGISWCMAGEGRTSPWPRRSAACFVAALPASGRAHPRGRHRRGGPSPVTHFGAGGCSRRCRRLLSLLPDPSPCPRQGPDPSPRHELRQAASDVPGSPVCRRLHARGAQGAPPPAGVVNQRLDGKRTFSIKEKFVAEAEENLDALNF